MIRYIPEDTRVVFAEVPDEVSLAINISGCPYRCPGCHSPYLQTDIGTPLTFDEIKGLINKDIRGITCVLFMGGEFEDLKEISKEVHKLNIKTAWYTGSSEVNFSIAGKYFDYIKTGPYIKSRGPLNNPNTNQRFYKIGRGYVEDITHKFHTN